MLKKKITTLLIGTNNKGKYKEIKDLLPKSIKIYSTSNFKLKSPIENGNTFKENSLLKAKYFSKKTNLICLADDSGLEIDCLNKNPGIFSARWGGRRGDFNKAMKEFNRILKPGGVFVALWNPRFISDNQILVDIENKILELNPKLKRVSSGKSEFVENLAKNFLSLSNFESLTFIEGRHKSEQNKEEYIGAWESVNDIQHQLGEKFKDFMNYIDLKIESDQIIKTTYLTRAWLVKKI